MALVSVCVKLLMEKNVQTKCYGPYNFELTPYECMTLKQRSNYSRVDYNSVTVT